MIQDFLDYFWSSDDSILCQHEIDYMGADPTRFDDPMIIQEDKYYDIMNKGCVWCGNDEFLKGPTGGLSVNVKCSGCGEKFNVMPVGEENVLAEPLTKRKIVKLL